MRIRLKWPTSLRNRQGLLFDLAVLFANLFLVRPLTRLMQENYLGSSTIGWVMLAAFIAHTLGAYLKRWPLQHRLAAYYQQGHLTPRSKKLLPFVVNILLIHYGLFLWMLIVGSRASKLDPSKYLLLLLGIGMLPTAMVIRALLPPKSLPDDTRPTHWSVELLANLVLYFSVLVIMTAWNVHYKAIFVGSEETCSPYETVASQFTWKWRKVP